ncbi:sugar-binding domain-containing protein [uncultured Draconibacterium sp.]|uniref:sugar-binding domain-containing protein n=1 Tax=uncultured Draconibacterium sp. TaxID=1573823 RepID=UPI002AA806DB|nr:sugar-binding domain-containing protein [uncultured Draconibacterium sp.]
MKNFIYILLFFMLCSCASETTKTIDLSGKWQFRMDTLDAGIQGEWFSQDFSEHVNLPGSMVENGKGFDITLNTKWIGGIQNPEWYKDPNYAPYFDADNIRFPFWLQPLKKYTGAAWYQKTVSIPVELVGKPLFLCLERPHWQSAVWINGEEVGAQNSLGTPHVFQIDGFVKSGENKISIQIDNRTDKIDVGINSHSITDHTQSNWNGIVGDLKLQVRNDIYFSQVDVFPDVDSRSIDVKCKVVNSTLEEQEITIPLFAQLKNSDVKTAQKIYNFKVTPGNNEIEMQYSLGDDALLWDEFNPNVYQLSVQLESTSGTDVVSEDFGLRDFKADGSQFAVNGRPVFLRGTLDCAAFPKTGYPPTGPDYWRKIYKQVKAHGLNHVRFHSWCPPEAAFEVADEMGVYLQVECGSWANQSTELGSGFPVDEYVWEESKRIVKEYGNHPSFVMMTYGNEPGGAEYTAYLTKFVNYWKKEDTRRQYTSAAGWPVIDANQYHNIPGPRVQGWAEELRSIINAEAPKTDYDWLKKLPSDGKPVVSHEIGQWCVYPNFKEIEKYTGVLKAKNFELFHESLTAHHMGELADSFLMASGKLQALCYKADIEAALRTPGFAGFQLLGLYDFPGQGTALVGVLDAFWDEKGYISPEEFSAFCNTTVPLARLDKRIFMEGETMTAKIEVAHFGAAPLNSVNPAWKITENNEVVAEGVLGQRNIEIGNAISLGEVVYQFQQKNTPRKLTLSVSIGEFTNAWDIWVYPKNEEIRSDEVKVVENLNNSTIEYLQNGGKVLLSLGKGKVSPEMGGTVGVGFSSIFWNTAWTDGQKPHTLGILCNPDHPALKYFPTEYHSNWQWWDAMSHADAVQLDAFQAELKPIVRIIDDWVSNGRLALLFEAKVGEGRVIFSGADLVNNIDKRPEAGQLKKSVISYMESSEFHPTEELSLSQVQSILK